MLDIRYIQEQDRDQVRKILVEAFSNRYDLPINDSFDSSKCISIVGELDGQVAGVATLVIIDKLNRKMGLIEDVAVSKEHQGKAVGRSLIASLKITAKTFGCDKIVLYCKRELVDWYTDNGFEENEVQMQVRL